MRKIGFSERAVAWRWREIKPNLREDPIPWTRDLLKRLLERCLEDELEVYLTAASHGRTPARQASRNGAYTWNLTTELGLLPDLTVARARTADHPANGGDGRMAQPPDARADQRGRFAARRACARCPVSPPA